MAIACTVLFTNACAPTPESPESTTEKVAVVLQTSTSFANQQFPSLLLTVAGAATSSLGNPVTIASITVNGAPATSPAQVKEGDYPICVTARSTTGVTGTQCETISAQWPRFTGRAVMYDGSAAVSVPGLVVTLEDGSQHPITSANGSFSVPSARAQFTDAKLTFADAGGNVRSVVRTRVTGPSNVVLIPPLMAIPACSVYGGTIVPVDLAGAYADASNEQSSYFDRINSIARNRQIVVASWNMPSIPVALSDTGATYQRFTALDSAEVQAALSTLSTYICQQFHLVPVAEARSNGVVIVKDPVFSALGAHSMALPTARGDLVRAEVVLRRVGVQDALARDSVRRTVMHEFMHVLGFGHTCSWRTVMTTGTACSAQYAFVPSAQDVAHYFVMRNARAGERALLTMHSLGPAYMGMFTARGGDEFALLPAFNSP